MIETKDLVHFLDHLSNKALDNNELDYIEEIVARLEELDKLKRLPENRGKKNELR